MHSLIGNVAQLRRMTWVDRWDRLAGYARILPFTAKRGAAYYCAKYVTKQSGEWEISDNLLAFKQYQPVLSLEGMIKPRLPPPRERREERRPLPVKKQFPLKYGHYEPVRGTDAAIEEVYRSEVTRGRGRFREFFSRSTDKD